MIIDAHAHVFPHLGTAVGYKDVETQLKIQQGKLFLEERRTGIPFNRFPDILNGLVHIAFSQLELRFHIVIIWARRTNRFRRFCFGCLLELLIQGATEENTHAPHDCK